MTLTPELINALETVAQMRAPSIANILRGLMYEYEARQVERLVAAWEDVKRATAVE